MLRIVTADDPGRADAERALLDRMSLTAPAVERDVRQIIEAVRARGDAAVREYTERFEKRSLPQLELSRGEWERQAASVTTAVKESIARAAKRIAEFHALQKTAGYTLEQGGARLELRVQPLERVGLYVPGGSARYPSSVLMTAVPAQIAGVQEIVMVTPGPSAETLYAAKVAGVHRVFVIGGAQAVAALAYGTESVPRVDKIVGPGNAWVAEAKRQLYGQVDIDAVAGPSEILVVADEGADPELIAADLLSQAEHDVEAYAVLLTTSLAVAQATARAVEEQLATLPRKEIAAESIRRHGVALVVASVAEALAFADRYAPEHLELLVADAASVATRVRHAGAIFVGAYTPEAAGDYLAGPNHVLPTGGTARYASPLGVYDFVKRTSILQWDAATLRAHAEDIERLAEVEGLHAHGRAVSRRSKS
ncbi:MAG: histidinol dehydrogenase [Myxococcales bacterium]|nr:histidinol dehydrogenase [Myxococcales bacterium]